MLAQAGEADAATCPSGRAARVRGGMMFVVRIIAESGRVGAALAPSHEWWSAGDSTY